MQTHSRSTIRRGAILIPLALAACFSLTGAAKTKDPPWIAKDWTQWSEDDCDEVLYGSPWGVKVGFGGTNINPSPIVSTVGVVIIQLRSGLPIRQALLRKQQVLNFYSKMKPDKKLAFDQAHAHDLDPSDQVLICIDHYGYQSPSPSGAVNNITNDVPGSPATQVALRLADGTLIQPTAATVVGMWVYENEIQYSFPRTVNNIPVPSPGEPSLVFELGADLRIKLKSGNFDQPLPFLDSGRSITFKLSDMMYKGKLEY